MGVQRVSLASLGFFSAFNRFPCAVEGFLDLRGILGVRSGVEFRVVEGFGVLRLLEIRRHGSLLHGAGTGSVHHLFWNEYCNNKEASHQA